MKQQYNSIFPMVFRTLCAVPNIKYTINCLYLDILGGTEATEMEKKGTTVFPPPKAHKSMIFSYVLLLKYSLDVLRTECCCCFFFFGYRK